MSRKDKNFTNEEVIEEVVDDVVEEVSEPVYETKDGVVYNCSSVYLRSNSYKNSDPLEVLQAGTTVTVIGEDGDFYKVLTSEGISGYIVKDYVNIK